MNIPPLFSTDPQQVANIQENGGGMFIRCDMSDLPEFKISEERTNFFMIPNLVDDMGLSVYAFRLYCRIKRVAGDNGACWQSTNTLAKACNMAAGSVTKAKNELLTRGIVAIAKKKHDTGQYEYHEITVKNIWEGATVHPMNGNRSPGELNRSPHETKNNPIKNKVNAPKNSADVNEAHHQRTLAALAKGQAEHSNLTLWVHDNYLLNPIWKNKNWQSLEAFLRTKSEDEIRQHGQWWWKHDWRGVKGQAPSPAQIIETWPQAFKPEPVHQGEVYR